MFQPKWHLRVVGSHWFRPYRRVVAFGNGRVRAAPSHPGLQRGARGRPGTSVTEFRLYREIWMYFTASCMKTTQVPRFKINWNLRAHKLKSIKFLIILFSIAHRLLIKKFLANLLMNTHFSSSIFIPKLYRANGLTYSVDAWHILILPFPNLIKNITHCRGLELVLQTKSDLLGDPNRNPWFILKKLIKVVPKLD
jgi:hypothetical protein